LNKQSGPEHRAFNIQPGAIADFPATYLPAGWYHPSVEGYAFSINTSDFVLTPIQTPAQVQKPSNVSSDLTPFVGKWEMVEYPYDMWKVAINNGHLEIVDHYFSSGWGINSPIVSNGLVNFGIYWTRICVNRCEIVGRGKPL
jgi:hypothetical protein